MDYTSIIYKDVSKYFKVLSDTLDETISYKLHIQHVTSTVCFNMDRLLFYPFRLIYTLLSCHYLTRKSFHFASSKAFQQMFSHVTLKKHKSLRFITSTSELYKMPVYNDYSHTHPFFRLSLTKHSFMLEYPGKSKSCPYLHAFVLSPGYSAAHAVTNADN